MRGKKNLVSSGLLVVTKNGGVLGDSSGFPGRKTMFGDGFLKHVNDPELL